MCSVQKFCGAFTLHHSYLLCPQNTLCKVRNLYESCKVRPACNGIVESEHSPFNGFLEALSSIGTNLVNAYTRKCVSVSLVSAFNLKKGLNYAVCNFKHLTPHECVSSLDNANK
eukprot:4529216-Amphidinium_carterae.1